MFLKVAKYSREELMGKNHRILKSGTQDDELFVGLWKTISSGNTWKGEITNKAKDGSLYYVSTVITPYKDINGQIEKYVAIRFDISAQKQQQFQLAEQKEELEMQTQKLQASEEELRVQHSIIQQSNQDLEENTQLLEEKNQAIIESNKSLEKARIELEEKAEALAITSKYKSEFLANMSHELRTPLNSILLLSKLLSNNKEANLTADQVEYSKVINNSGNGLLELINEILDISKIESGKMETEYSDVKIASVIENMNSVFLPLANDKGIKFSIEAESSLPEFIRTDRMRLEQVLKNLFSNAFKFTEKGSVKLNITKNKNSMAFAVSDSGIGIPKDKQNMVFEAFQQADGSTKRKYGGTGLGLSISREIAKLLGGELLLESEEGKGSTFTLYLPLNGKHIPLQPKDQEGNNPKAQQESVTSYKEQSQNFIVADIPAEIPDDRNDIQENDKLILIVEDDTNFAKILLNLIHEKGYKGIVIVRGDQAVPFAENFNPAGILLDLQLPVMDGWTVMDLLKANDSTRHIPVHIMSSYDGKKESLERGAVDFISKPVAIEKVTEAINRLDNLSKKLKKKLLIIEDSETHSKAISSFLTAPNLECIMANTAKDGLHLLEKEEVDCVILDMGLPDATGYEVMENIRKNPKFESLPIIVYTGKSLSKSEENKINKYASTIIIKTVDSYERLLDETSLFLHLVKKQSITGIEKPKKPYIADKALENKTVLIADDDVRNIFSLTKALESYNMKIVTADTGIVALKQLEENPQIDLVLMDIMMPEMDGFEAIAEIRKNNKLNKLPIIAVTAKAMLGDRAKCIEAGASDYISKPVDIDQLISLIRVWLYN